MFVDNQKFDDCFNALLGYIYKNDEIDEEIICFIMKNQI